jgi:LemA protein
MSKKWVPLAVIGGVVLVVVLFSVSRYNSLVSTSEEVDSSWAQVENVLQRRADLVPNLVETVKGFAAQEKEVFANIAEARSRLAGAQGPAEAGAANQELSSALSRLLVVVENYPDLKSNQNFMRLQDELAGTENRIAVERKRYNDAVRDYNATIKRFPSNIFAGMFGFGARQYFEVDEAARAVPQVKFNE